MAAIFDLDAILEFQPHLVFRHFEIAAILELVELC